MAESVAGREEINSEAKERKRKPNFSLYEIGMITEKFQVYLTLLLHNNETKESL